MSSYPPGFGIPQDLEHMRADEPEDCPNCGGIGHGGEVIEGPDGPMEEEHECPTCEGTGIVTPAEPEPEWEPKEERG